MIYVDKKEKQLVIENLTIVSSTGHVIDLRPMEDFKKAKTILVKNNIFLRGHITHPNRLQARITKANEAQIEVSAYYSILDKLIVDLVGKPKIDDEVSGMVATDQEPI